MSAPSKQTRKSLSGSNGSDEPPSKKTALVAPGSESQKPNMDWDSWLSSKLKSGENIEGTFSDSSELRFAIVKRFRESMEVRPDLDRKVYNVLVEEFKQKCGSSVVAETNSKIVDGSLVSVQEFAAGEHCLLGSELVASDIVKAEFETLYGQHSLFRLTALRIGATSDRMFGVAQLDFGQIIALAGDFICLEDEGVGGVIAMALDDQIESRFRKAFDKLWTATKNDRLPIYQSCVNGILAEAEAVRAARDSDPQHLKSSNPTAQVYKSWYDFLYGRDLDYATRLADRSNLLRYWDALVNNFDHFNYSRYPDQGGFAIRVYRTGHRLAMKVAAEANGNWLGLNEAMCIEAFACHYLTDSFAGGHVRTPRFELDQWCEQRYSILKHSRAGWRAHDMHDEDGTHGVWICSDAHPLPWQAFGDGELFNRDNYLNRYMIATALHAALTDVRISFESKKIPNDDSVKVWAHLPRYAEKDPRNFPPLFKVEYSASQPSASSFQSNPTFQILKRESKWNSKEAAEYKVFLE